MSLEPRAQTLLKTLVERYIAEGQPVGSRVLSKLSKLSNVSKNAWIGKEAVTFSGRTYEVPKDVLCYNLDSREWITLEKALAYADTANLYAKDGVIRVVEVKH